jgi:VWFA-related protein
VKWVLPLVATAALIAGQPDRPSFRSGTRLIEVSVVVTNRDRGPAPGLTADDFEIFDNGKPQKVELFSIEAGSAAAPVPAPPPPERGPREFSNDLAGIGGVTIVLFDRLNTPDRDWMRARQHVIRFLERIGPGDRVGLYVLDGMGVLRVLHDFTSDAGALLRAISGLRGDASLPLAAEADAGRLGTELAALLTDGERDAGSREMAAHFQGNRAVHTIDALESIGHHLSGIQNRKNLIWVSAAFPLSVFQRIGRSPVAEINRATRSLNDGNVALYAVDARGLIPTFTGVPGNHTVTTLSMVQGNQDILLSLSEQTGGRAFLNTNDIQGAIRRAADDARMTYVLGYYPADDRWDGRFHRINVKVKRPGFDVRHRQGYFAVATLKQADSQRTAALNAAVVSPIDASALGLTVRVEPVTGKPSDYRLTIRVQPSAIALERRDGASLGALDVVVAQVRPDGAEGRSLQQQYEVRVPDDRLPQFQRQGVSVDHTFTLTPTAERLRVVVRDVRTGAIGAIGVSRQQLEAIR